MVLNVFPFRTKLQNHTQPMGKKVLVRKVGQEQHPTPPLHTPSLFYTLSYNI